MKLFTKINAGKRLSLFQTAVFILIFLFTSLLLWTIFPSPINSANFISSPIRFTDDEWIIFHGSPVALKPFRIAFAFPKYLRPGEDGEMTISVDILSEQLAPSAQVAADEVPLLELAETYQVMLLARLELAGVVVNPPAEISRPIIESGDQVYDFHWHLWVNGTGKREGTIWLYLQLHDPGREQTYLMPILARDVNIDVKNWGLLTLDIIKILSAVGLGISLIVFLALTFSNRRYFMP